MSNKAKSAFHNWRGRLAGIFDGEVRPWWRRRERVVVGAFGVLVSVYALYRLTLWPLRQLPEFVRHDQVKMFELENAARRTVALIVAAALGLIALYLSWRRANATGESIREAQEGLSIDRFARAIEQLGKMDGNAPNTEVRLGGMYALERIATDSRRDRCTILAVLAAYVRRNAAVTTLRGDEGTTPDSETKPRIDIQTALNILTRPPFSEVWMEATPRTVSTIFDLSQTNLTRADLSGTCLRWARLMGTRLSGADLSGARLMGADLTGSCLSGANLSGTELGIANLSAASLSGATLVKAELGGANLTGANLSGADLNGASLFQADLSGANLAKANLKGVIGVTANQIRSARHWRRGIYDQGLRNELGLDDPVSGGEVAKNPDAT